MQDKGGLGCGDKMSAKCHKRTINRRPESGRQFLRTQLVDSAVRKSTPRTVVTALGFGAKYLIMFIMHPIIYCISLAVMASSFNKQGC